MAKQVCLLDFDGVVLRHKAGQEAVTRRCQLYVQRHTCVKDMRTVKELNRNLYEATGHTMLGLKKLGYPVNIKEFNHYVYRNIDYNLFKNIRETHQDDINVLKNIQQLCSDTNTPLYIFSAAPDIWCQSILNMMDDKLANINTLSNITGRHLKPDMSGYDQIEAIFKGKQLHFVDDKLINLFPVFGRDSWTNYLMCDQAAETDNTKHINGIHVINKLSSFSIVFENIMCKK